MRRGGRGSNVQGPWRRRDDAAIPSALHFNRWWTARNCVGVMVLAACSMAISLLIWSSRPGPGHGLNLQSSNSGIVFPLYHYRRQIRNGCHGMEGCERPWRTNRAGTGRRIRQVTGQSNPLMNVRGGHRLSRYEMEQFYVEMELGVPPANYYFHIDTGSGVTWIYCNTPSHVSNIVDWGPHGYFVPEDKSHVKCAGATATFCRQLQDSSSRVEPCERADNYQCKFIARYADDSNYSGFVVNESFTVTMQDKSETNLFGSFGCVTTKVRVYPETLPLMTDGLIGLGNCKTTLLDQWATNKLVKQSVLGVCLAKRVDSTTLPSPAAPVGYISMGMDFKEKFDPSNSVWSELTTTGKMILCAHAATLLSISFDQIGLVVAAAMVFDTGSDLTYLAANVYGPLLQTLDNFATNRGYLGVADNPLYAPQDQRVCWLPPAQILAKASPVHDFPPLTFAFEGIHSSVQYLSCQPENYLDWNAHETKLCVRILQDAAEYSVSNLGADLLREHLFVFDIENQRVRWLPDDCELK